MSKQAPFHFPGGLLSDAAIVFEAGRILSLGPIHEQRKLHPDAQIIDAGNSIILPGLVNPHVHLELSGCPCLPASSSFTDWVLSLATRIGPDRDFAAATHKGIARSLRFGVTTVGDISQQMDITRPILASSPLRAVGYGETLGLAGHHDLYEKRFEQAIDRTYDSERFHSALSPHAPYTVDLPGYRQCLAAARQLNLRLATHLAETPYEEEFLRHQTGPFRQLYEALGLEISGVETCKASPVEFAQAIGLLSDPTLLAHVNFCNDDELAILARGRASVVYCPRTHTYFGHPPHRFRDMLAAGINLAIGTDSCASSPDLNLLDDLRLVHRLHPDVPAEDLFRLITTNAARALQMEHSVGALVPGHCADLTIFPVRTSKPLNEILETDVLPHQVWIGGQRVPGATPAGTPASPC